MKLLVKIGVGALFAGAGVLLVGNVNAANPQAQADFAAIQNAQVKAKVENDRIKLNCINDKLVLAKAVLNLIDGGDSSQLKQLHDLRVAAENCAGKRQVSNESDNSFTAPPGATEPGDNGAPDWGVTFEPPVNASPTKPTTPRKGVRGLGPHH